MKGMPNDGKLAGFDTIILTNASNGNYSIFTSTNAIPNANAYSETTFTEI
jgi:hypothetical protein